MSQSLKVATAFRRKKVEAPRSPTAMRLLRPRTERTRSLSRDGLFDYARILTEQHSVQVLRRGSKHLFKNFSEQCRRLEFAHQRLSEAAAQKDLLTPGAEWLLDNYHIIQQQITDIRKHFPRGYDKTLPKLVDGPYDNYPRVYHLAVELLSQSDAVVDLDLLRSFIDGYQSASHLTMGELWAVPIMLRFALVENISMLAQRFLTVREERREAEHFVDELLGDESRTGTQIVLLLAARLLERPDFLATGAPYLLRRLRERGRKASLTLQWLEEWLREEGSEPEEILRSEQYTLAADQITIGNSVNSLKTIDYSDWKAWVESVSKVDEVLRRDPAEVYSRCDFKTRDRYRHVIEKLAKRSPLSEYAVAERAIVLTTEWYRTAAQERGAEAARRDRRSHVGYYLLDGGRAQFEKSLNCSAGLGVHLGRFIRRHAVPFYLGLILLITLVTVGDVVWTALRLDHSWVLLAVLALLLLAPVSDIATNIVQWAVTHVLPPDYLPKLDFRSGIPEECRTVVVVQAIFGDKEAARKTVEGLEVRYLANPERHAAYGVLADLADADEPVLPGDREIIAYARELIAGLRVQYPEARFFILFRDRQWNASQQKFLAWERKRGKVEEFNRLLLGKGETSFLLTDEDRQLLRGFRYVVTLDNDSQLPRGTLAKLVGTIAHPLNTPVVNPVRQHVIDGYAIIQPRMGISLVSAHSSVFAEIFSGHAGLDPYTQTVSEVYQDLFREGSYIGKGIYDLHAFATVLEHRVPENTLLSHDLFEGLFARVALATDIELFDDFPSKYHVHSRRHHRWVRGDWQLLPWLLPWVRAGRGRWRRNPINALGRWKIFDNLRRSLVAPSLFFLLWFAWTCLTTPGWYWALFVFITISFPVYVNFAQAFLIPTGISVGSHFRGLGRDLAVVVKQAVFTLCFLPHQAYLMLHAIGITLWRVLVSRRNLLEWETAYHSERRLGHGLRSFLLEMTPGLLLVLLCFATSLWLGRGTGNYHFAIFVLWLSSPLLAKQLSEPIRRDTQRPNEEQREYLLTLAWKTWRFFRELADAENNFLPPDNIQLVPQRIVAHRTSPTNISLSLLGTFSAYDCGFFPLPGACERVARTFDSLLKLERFRGHFFNWYQTQTLEALRPKYVSTVDSGNLTAHLLALRPLLRDASVTPLFTERHLLHARRILREALEGVSSSELQEEIIHAIEAPLPANLPQALTLFHRLADLASQLRREASRQEEVQARRRLEICAVELEDIGAVRQFLAWIPLFHDWRRDSVASAAELQEVLQQLEQQLLLPFPSLAVLKSAAQKVAELKEAERDAPELVRQLREVLPRFTVFEKQVVAALAAIDQFLHEIDFRFLYDDSRDLFSIGYHVDNARRDSSYYDLLASEARLTSLVAIAFGQVPQQHWFAMGRPLTDSLGGRVLLSWAGTMFEYLMPLLVTKSFPATLLNESYLAAVRAQQVYCRRRGAPWGVSESGFSGVDFEKTYQYRAFGVPGLGLKRGLEEDLVISPYSTCLALLVAFPEAMANFPQLEQIGLRGEYGFYEAADFTSARLAGAEKRHIVQSFLAHHQGMSLVAINNVLHDGIFQQRFHLDPQVKATELLLHEKFPERLPILAPQATRVQRSEMKEQEALPVYIQSFDSAQTRVPRTHLLSNGRYSIMLDNAGSGYSIYDREIALTRWSEDGVTNAFGNYVFVRDVDSNDIWSVSYQPLPQEAESYEVVFSPDKAEYKRKDHEIFIHEEITVSPEEDVEIRKLSLTNLSGKRRVLELTSYAEIVLGNQRADAIHPAFSKMFVESELLSEMDCLLFSRRPRAKDEEGRFFFHLATLRTVWDSVQVESSRYNFIGRGNSIRDAEAVFSGLPLSGTTGLVLDPVAALRVRVEIEPGRTETVNFVSGFAKTRAAALDLASRYRELHRVSRAFEMAWSQSSVELRNEQVFARQAHVYQQLANLLLFNVEKHRAESDVLVRNKLAQPNLWRFGISGDLPIALVRITEPDQTGIIRELLHAHHYLRIRGLAFDLVILNEYPGGYLQNLQEELEFLIRSSLSGSLAEKKGGIFLRTSLQVSDEERELLQTVARVVLSGFLGGLAAQVKIEDEILAPLPTPPRKVHRSTAKKKRRAERLDVEFPNGYGGFVDDGRAYRIQVEETLPPLPWSNVVANPHFGFLVTESGGGFTWSDNSRENRLSPWSNDPVTDPLGEVIYLRDPRTGAYWCPTPRPVKVEGSYQVEHRRGATRFVGEHEDIRTTLQISIARQEKVKWFSLALENQSKFRRQIEVFFYVEWVLGVLRAETYRYHVTGYEPTSGAVYALNYYNQDFAGRLSFIGSNHKIVGFTTSREEFVGRNLDLGSPLMLAGANENRSGLGDFVRLSRRTGAGFDACGVIKVILSIDPKKREEVDFFLGEALSKESLKHDAARLSAPQTASLQRQAQEEHFAQLTSVIEAHTPERSFDLLVNGWLPYQVLSARLHGRTGFYQSSGAFGFRDQLQDALSLAPLEPEIVRTQILLHASRQFPEGDVQHWWHPPTGRGSRTKMSDDFLWLPYVVKRYLDLTGRSEILNDMVGFIEGPNLQEHEHEVYIQPRPLARSASIYEHCVLAIDHALRFGARGLPLMGIGDWNDGMNTVGIEGRGESVWLGWFLLHVLRLWTPLVRARGEEERAQRYEETAAKLQEAIERDGWDGSWYRRAYFDDGTPLGSEQNDECKIDLIAQAWAVMARDGRLTETEHKRVDSALAAVSAHLVNSEKGLIALLAPPFNKTALEPGYIKGYPPGVRENGGQYTHAAAWIVIAYAMLGEGTTALKLFNLINPVNHTRDRRGVHTYKGEPYVLAGDVYAASPFEGRAGWTWYTGSAGWMYQAAVEHILGLKLHADHFTVSPCVPHGWHEFSLSYRREQTRFFVRIENGSGVERGVREIEIDGELVPEGKIFFERYRDRSLVDVRVVMG